MDSSRVWNISYRNRRKGENPECNHPCSRGQTKTFRGPINRRRAGEPDSQSQTAVGLPAACAEYRRCERQFSGSQHWRAKSKRHIARMHSSPNRYRIKLPRDRSRLKEPVPPRLYPRGHNRFYPPLSAPIEKVRAEYCERKRKLRKYLPAIVAIGVIRRVYSRNGTFKLRSANPHSDAVRIGSTVERKLGTIPPGAEQKISLFINHRGELIQPVGGFLRFRRNSAGGSGNRALLAQRALLERRYLRSQPLL